MQREPTGINGFDELVEGGIPANSVTLVSGSPGTGKSIFSQQFLHTGAKQFKEKGLYISFEQRIPEIYEQAKQLGFDFEALEKQGLVKFVFLDITNRQLASEETYIDVIKKEIREFAPKRLVIDSLVPLANIPASPEELIAYGLISNVSSFMPNIPPELVTRFQVHRLIMALKDTKTTSIIVSEISKDSKWLSSDRVSEFMSDGVILMHYLGIGSTSNRSLTIEKMRGTKHSEDVLPIEITKNGIKVNKQDKYDV
ncbi:AAA family ATPase [Candidatus Micrarchaeota archaeon]|nr:AAA family ATPase [Candidatus Micrarchaeota archaeon]